MPLILHAYPRAILHIDGDSFFASCEVAKEPSLRGRPVITGKERGIASSMTYEAKARGVIRGMRISETLKVCPDAVILPSDYETYSIYSERMYNIVRRYTPEVDEYSIDECFADLTGLRRPLRMSYEAMAERIKEELRSELGMTFSIGLAPTKVLAKIGSKWRKPDGLTCIPGHLIHEYLLRLPVHTVWGIGPQTSLLLQKYGVKTAYELATKEKEWITSHLSKPYQEVWRELRGEVAFELNLEKKLNYQSISKTKTFTPASSDRAFILSQLSKNVENACIKARRHNLVTSEIYFFLKKQDFRYVGLEVKLSQPVSVPGEVLRAIRGVFDVVYRPKTLYRATGIVLGKLREDVCMQQDLFGASTTVEKAKVIYDSVDMLSEKFGKHAVFLGSSFKAMTSRSHKGDRSVLAGRSTDLFKGETKRRRLDIPLLGDAF